MQEETSKNRIIGSAKRKGKELLNDAKQTAAVIGDTVSGAVNNARQRITGRNKIQIKELIQ